MIACKFEVHINELNVTSYYPPLCKILNQIVLYKYKKVIKMTFVDVLSKKKGAHTQQMLCIT